MRSSSSAVGFSSVAPDFERAALDRFFRVGPRFPNHSDESSPQAITSLPRPSSRAPRPTPHAPRPPCPRSAFTLIEILLVIAVMALLSTLFITGVGVLASRDERTLDEVFEQAMREARWLALEGERPVILGFDNEKKVFYLTRQSGGERLHEYPIDRNASVRFLKQRPRATYVLIRGELVQTEPVEQVTFFPDGSSIPFTVELHYGYERRTYVVDPWTGAPLPED